MTVIERFNARALAARRAAVRSRADRGRRVVHLAAHGAAGRCSPARRRASTRSRSSSRSSRSGAGWSATAASSATARCAAGRCSTWPRRPPASAPRCAGSHPSGLPGPKGNIETFIALAEGARGSRRRARGAGAARPTRDERAHDHGADPRAPGRDRAGRCASWPSSRTRHGVVLALDPEETAKHALRRADRRDRARRAARRADADLCVTLGGDGTILRALRTYAAHRACPCSRVNFGQVGFLATVEPRADARGLRARARRDARRPAACRRSSSTGPPGGHTALNDVSLHRQVGGRVAELSYAVGGEEIGSVRCDGLVVATPAGSTGYNLANGGPVMAWGVAGMVVSFIAPHSLSARALVIAPDDVLRVHNSSREPLAVSVDGRPVGEIAPERGRARRGSPTTSRRSRRWRARASTSACARSSARCRAEPRLRGRVAAFRPRALVDRVAMLLELSVQNLLLIEDARLELAGGLNVITGETGAGKTVLAHALDLLLGGRARPGIVRPGAARGLRRRGLRAAGGLRARASRGRRRRARARAARRRRRPHARVPRRALDPGRRSARAGRRGCCRSTASTSTAG